MGSSGIFTGADISATIVQSSIVDESFHNFTQLLREMSELNDAVSERWKKGPHYQKYDAQHWPSSPTRYAAKYKLRQINLRQEQKTDKSWNLEKLKIENLCSLLTSQSIESWL